MGKAMPMRGQSKAIVCIASMFAMPGMSCDGTRLRLRENAMAVDCTQRRVLVLVRIACMLMARSDLWRDRGRMSRVKVGLATVACLLLLKWWRGGSSEADGISESSPPKDGRLRFGVRR